MRKLLFVLLSCMIIACIKNTDQMLISKKWIIESVTVKPAMKMGDKTSENYIELSGSESCVANLSLTFSKDKTYVAGASGALCDRMADASIKTWQRDGDKVILSGASDAPLSFDDSRLVQTTTTAQDGKTYTFVYIYKAK